MKLIVDIPEEVAEYIKNNGCLSVAYNDEVAKAIQNGTPLSKFLEELKRKILMEVDGGTDDRYLSYIDICDRISNSIDEYKAESELKGENNG